MDRETFEIALRKGRLESLMKSGEMAKVFPEVQAMVGFGGGNSGHKDLWAHTKQVVSQCPATPHVRWAALFHDVGKVQTYRRTAAGVSFHKHEAMSAKLWNKAARRSGWFSDQERRDIRFLIYNLGRVEAYESGWTDKAVRRLARNIGGYWDDIMALARADITTIHRNKRRAHHARMAELNKRRKELLAAEAVPPALPKGLGDVLMAELGLEPGPALGDLMRALRAAVEAGDLPRSADHAVYVDWCRRRHAS